MEDKKFSDFLNELIEKSGLEKKEIGPKARVTASYITALTSGRNRAPSFEILKKIAEVLKLNHEDEERLIYLGLKDRMPGVLEYLISPRGTAILREKGKEIYYELVLRESVEKEDVDENILRLVRVFFSSKKIPKTSKEGVMDYMRNSLNLFGDERVKEMKQK